ncbi:MAG: lipopolysaccharide heptosyltransferase II [Candidatus Omnitrophica bacterium]|nr:lipopolysaccharide heptosyltransferase II [Candidatus Omnitrophota bacterium]
MKRILIVNVNWRGDVLFSTPFLRAIRENFPEAFIATLVVPRCVPILENNPDLNEIIVFDERGKQRGLWGKMKLIRLLRTKNFDLAFILHRSLTRTLICWLAGIPERVGYYTKKRSLFLTKNIFAQAEPVHKVDYFLKIAQDYGVPVKNRDYQFLISQDNRDYADKLLQEQGVKKGDFLVVLNPGGNWDLKRWPKENFALLGDSLVEKYQARVLITGAAKDIKLAEEIAALMKNQPLLLCGKTTLGELAALMAKVNLVVANDSGPMHIALSQGAKVIALFGPTAPKITGPYGRGNYTVIQKDVGCAVPCYELNCTDQRCMKAISVQEVLQAIAKMRQDENK